MPRQSPVIIVTPEHQARLDQALQAVEIALQEQSNDAEKPRTLTERDPVEELSEEYERLKAEAEAAGVRVTLRGLTDLEWDEFAEKHPPRTEGPKAEQDKLFEFNVQTGRRDLIFACLVEPAFDSRAAFDEWLRERQFSSGEVMRLVGAAWTLTHGATTDPKSLPASATRRGGGN